MAETLKGKAAVWGVKNMSFTGVVIDSSTAKFQSMDGTRDSEVASLDDDSGECCGESFYNAKKVINITVIPFHATAVATAYSAMEAMLPSPGTTITLADGNITGGVWEGTNSGKYNVISAKMGRTNKGYATIEAQIRQYDANDVTTAIS